MTIASSIVSPCVIASGTSGNVTTKPPAVLSGVNFAGYSIAFPFISFQTERLPDALHGARLHFFLVVHRNNALPVAEVHFQVASLLRAECTSLLFQPPLELGARQVSILHRSEKNRCRLQEKGDERE